MGMDNNQEKFDKINALCESGSQAFNDGDYKSAVKEFVRALELCRELSQIYPEEFEPIEGTILHNLGIVYANFEKYAQAEAYYTEALQLRRRLASQNSEVYDKDIAETFSCLAVVHQNADNIERAEQEYKEALSIYRHLAQNVSGEFDLQITGILHNLGIVCSLRKNYEQAEAYYTEALQLRRRLVLQNPDLYDDLANTLKNSASFHEKIDRIEEAEAEYSEALFIYRRLAQTDPETFEPEVATMLFCISTLEMEYFDDYETAEVGLTESLEIARRCAKKGDEILPTLASVLFALSNWHISAGSCTQGEAECVEALKIYRRLDKISPGAFDEGKAMTLYNLGVLHEKKADKQSEVERAKKELSEALSIFRKLAETQYETYESRISKTTDLLEKLRNATDDSHSAN